MTANEGAIEWRLAAVEREVETLKVEVSKAIETRILVQQLTKRVERMAIWAMTASGLLVATLAVLLTVLKLK